ncbi:low molecular weight protein-tyrosine-phosphatase [Salirhabdus salicampi]|uniref:low molecular weight protein-tyrosine-phosphatase n=1 Tax=Salirhabdus salicampi TaxID=476102 RepID=UPI0020C1EE5A|nr:low molecular weight protein-tyrosine-phosphatase [Salirhabdus salicampi]MCP8617908.1 low molecular weight phosphotyrosine protein phosphatase [Salirhabdus salicampi]
MIKVLFVCLGNICRSPMAEAMFREMVKENDLQGKITVDSAGIGHWHQGQPPHVGTQNILKDHVISTKGMTARQVKYEDWDEFDYIVAMDEQNMQDLTGIRKEFNNVRIQRLMDYVPNATKENVPDPYYTGNFQEVYDLVKAGCEHLLQQIKEDYNL